jgi:hypothetical protein
VSGAASASLVPFTPVGNVASTNVQAAIAEVDSEKVAKAGDVMTGPLSVNGTVNVTGHLSLTTNGGMTLGGWGGNANISVIFLNAGQSHYLYHDAAGNISFSGCPSVSAGNGRLWGSGDFGTPVSNGRLAYAGDLAFARTEGATEPYGGAVTTSTWQRIDDNSYWNRYRYMQLYTTGWFTTGYA